MAKVADVSREDDVMALRDATLAAYGRIDVLVNNAGVNPIYRGIEKIGLDDWANIVAVNLHRVRSASVRGGTLGGKIVFRWAFIQGPCVGRSGQLTLATVLGGVLPGDAGVLAATKGAALVL